MIDYIIPLVGCVCDFFGSTYFFPVYGVMALDLSFSVLNYFVRW